MAVHAATSTIDILASWQYTPVTVGLRTAPSHSVFSLMQGKHCHHGFRSHGLWSSRVSRVHCTQNRSRARNQIAPKAMFSQFDPFISWPQLNRIHRGGSSFPGSAQLSGEQRLAAASTAQQQAMLSTAISGVTDWQQLFSIVMRYGDFMTANNVSHALTKLEQVVRGRSYTPAVAAQVRCRWFSCAMRLYATWPA